MSAVKSLLATTLAFGFISMVGCSDDDDNDTPADTSPPAISNLSHVDNEKVIGNRTITFTADVTDDVGATVTISHNGNPVSVTPGGNTYTANITLGDRTNNTIVVTAKDADNTTTETLTLNYPFLAFTNGQAASVVIGQPNFDSFGYNQGGAPGANTLANGSSLLVVNNALYIVDDGNNRVLGFNAIPTINNANANFVIGQSDFSGSAGGLTNMELSNPKSIAYNSDNYFVLHGNNASRANHWTSLPVNNDAADFVVGQSDFGTGVTGSCQQDKFSFAQHIEAVSNKLMVSDITNNRLLIWNSFPTSSGVSADLVLGQQDFTHCQRNDANNDGVDDGIPTASTLRFPSGVWSDGVRLILSDSQNKRVLIWNTFPTANAQAADLVLGQVNFITADPASTTVDSFSPGAIASNGNQIFLSDGNSSRILIWDSWPTTNNQGADRVLGANDFVGDVSELNNASTFLNADGRIEVTDNKLLVLDNGNSRVLIFEAP